METDQAQPDASAAEQSELRHIATIIILALLVALLLWLNLHKHIVTFQNIEAHAYGFPLLMVYHEPHGDTTKLDPATQINWLTLYFDIFFSAMVLVCSFAIVRRLTRGRSAEVMNAAAQS